jgi:hypothetical protein
MNNTLLQDIKQEKFILDQLKARRRENLKGLNETQRNIKLQEEKIFNLVELLEKSYQEVI